ncbi:hypothetical protein BSK65_10715 [Paenibacillus odorifer]|uniref:Uncharacterized protein n=1 Tax=Paenibacillus odorifer TaxID=189426 RepID=A0A1R0ZJH0_9BACL|nr:hypothetical protein [Paenibacillus odorifer]OME71504.1 hypothetical protein BSK65_10715 [Paenibacillus odorifer]
MFTNEQLGNSLKQASELLRWDKGFDNFVFRMGFKEETSLTDAQKDQILSYLEVNVSRNDPLYIKAKAYIDQSEMSSDYFHNYPRKFRGAYYPVVMQFIAGLMVNSLDTRIDDNNNRRFIVDEVNNPWCEADTVYDDVV